MGRILLGIALLAPVVLVLLAIAAPRFSGGVSGETDPLPGAALLLTATIGYLVGLVWMIRIQRADPEPDQRAWRYRER